MSQPPLTFEDLEQLATERSIWWRVYLVRERRRLSGIAQAVRPNQPAQATGPRPDPPAPVQPLPGESASDYLARADAEAITPPVDTPIPDPPDHLPDSPAVEPLPPLIWAAEAQAGMGAVELPADRQPGLQDRLAGRATLLSERRASEHAGDLPAGG